MAAIGRERDERGLEKQRAAKVSDLWILISVGEYSSQVQVLRITTTAGPRLTLVRIGQPLKGQELMEERSPPHAVRGRAKGTIAG